MYTIVMNSDKSLSRKNIITLYQREKLIDKIKFMIPVKYGEIDLLDYVVTLKYINQANEAHVEILTPSDEYYKDVLRCFYLPIDTNLTKFAGDIELRLTLSKVDEITREQSVLHSGKTTITIQATEAVFKIDENLELIDQLLGKVQAVEERIEYISEVKADNIRQTNDEIQLESNGVLIGDVITIGESDSVISINENGIPVVEFNKDGSDSENDGSEGEGSGGESGDGTENGSSGLGNDDTPSGDASINNDSVVEF